MTVLKDVELWWVKCDPKKPVSPFGEPVWEINARTKKKKQADEWKKASVNVKKSDDDTYWFANLKRKAVFGKTGDPMPPVVFVGGQLMPIDPNTVGNGSIGNVQLYTKDWEFNGHTGTKIELKAVQVTKLIEYQGGSGLAFDDVGETEIVAKEPEAGEDSSDLWD